LHCSELTLCSDRLAAALMERGFQVLIDRQNLSNSPTSRARQYASTCAMPDLTDHVRLMAMGEITAIALRSQRIGCFLIQPGQIGNMGEVGWAT
jgi:hypothetical protein